MKLPRPPLKRARIEIIPMIDTIFFLLVFFMVTSLSMVPIAARKVALPESSTAKARPLEKVILTLSKDGAYSVDRQSVAFDAILPALTAKVRQNPDITVVLNADRAQTVAKFQALMRVAEAARPAHLSIATSPKSP